MIERLDLRPRHRKQIEARDWARLSESFHREIERDYVVLVRGMERTAGRVSDAY